MIGITLTGADERTAIADMVALADLGAEIGLLYTHDPEGRHRYPSLDWLHAAADALRGRAALHVCGSRARKQLEDGKIDYVLHSIHRIQVNGSVHPFALETICEQYSGKLVITQHCAANVGLLGGDLSNHVILIDGSGGRGISPAEWVRPRTHKQVGFAGGLGPHNLHEELPKIEAVASGTWWIDMENGLRDACDWFDIERAMEVMRIWNGFWEAKN